MAQRNAPQAVANPNSVLRRTDSKSPAVLQFLRQMLLLPLLREILPFKESVALEMGVLGTAACRSGVGVKIRRAGIKLFLQTHFWTLTRCTGDMSGAVPGEGQRDRPLRPQDGLLKGPSWKSSCGERKASWQDTGTSSLAAALEL